MKRMSQLASDWFDFPAEVVGTLPRIEWIGQRLQIENFQGVHQFNPDLLILKTANGLLTVKGDSLVMEAIYPDRVLLTGKITAIHINNKE
ncbi:YabP/YqfC family sporulation protein [Shimazuella kribbensis]|uniref:YabP/YqfC family sporulation protein n=1 Tax=Shimazuella kribbensis TaxID=139808 RepID=UPI0003FD20EB|nr:YabP/YqfC family sporulation protein [Shimazuella kribbensis]